MIYGSGSRRSSLAIGTLITLSTTLAAAQDPIAVDSPRRDDLVRLLQQAGPAAVDILGSRVVDGVQSGWVGAGVVIHPAGYIVTNDHVASDGSLRVVDSDGRSFPAHVVGREHEVDLAVLRVDSDRQWSTIPIGRSDDLMLGEPAIVIGNPVGLSHSVTRGVVSRLPATYDLQVSAPINGGNSGGPVLNACGLLIGIVRAKAGEGLGFAIPIDRMRDAIPRMLLDESEDGYRIGVAVDTLGPTATVQSVTTGGPSDGKLLPGDVISRIGTTEVDDGIAFYLFAGDRDPGSPLDLTVQRGHETLGIQITPIPIVELPAVDVEKTGYGARYRVFQGGWSALPDVATLTPQAQGFTNAIGHAPPGAPADQFTVEYEALIHIETAGAWTFFSSSDDGSRLWIDDQLVVDNDGLHSILERRATVRLAAGHHALRVLFFEGTGDQALHVSWQGPNRPKEEIPAAALLHRAP